MVRILDNLENRNVMSPWQLAIVIAVAGAGAAVVSSPKVLVSLAGHFAWLIPVLGGALYFGVAYLMIKLGNLFPGDSFSRYLQQIWGRRAAVIIVWWFIVVILGELFVRIQMFAREIVFFMFDRTPPEVIALTMIGIAAYCAVQDVGTVIRVSHILFFSALPMLMGMIMLGFINFQFINLYPFWPVNLAAIFRASLESQSFYFGYQSILYFLPWVYRANTSPVKTIGSAFALKTILMVITIIMVIGTQTVDGINATPYPTLVAIRGVELPGTFVERLDNYLFLAWIPIMFITCAVNLFIIAKAAAEIHGYIDHRPFVLLFLPVLFFGGLSLHDLTVFEFFAGNVQWPGLVFSFGVIPATYLVAKWKQRRQGVTSA